MGSAILFRLFKYAIYALLTVNVYLFFAEEHAAVQHQFANGVPWRQIIEAYAATIDTAAWVVLLLMFELETAVLSDDQFTKPVVLSLHTLRAVCYTFIVYAFYGYVANLVFSLGAVTLPGLADLCTLAAGDWVYAVDFDEYEVLTAANCSALSQGAPYFRFPAMQAVVDASGLTDIVRLAWVDVINSAVWLLVVLVLELDVRLQEHQRLEGVVLRVSTGSKFILYSLLLLAAVYWGVKGDFVDFWDAFLWLVAFAFIELNILEWRQEDLEAAAAAAGDGSPAHSDGPRGDGR